MKRIITLFTTLLVCTIVFLGQEANAQAAEKMSYQAVIRNASNVLVANQNVGMQVSILQGSATGTAVYVETQTAITNANGLVSIEIGNGTTSNNFSTINWANGPYFIKTETDATGGTNYTITGTSQLLSVPYALYAKTSGSSIPGPQGPQGPQGVAGATGPVGATGAQGIAGPTGATGATGSQGSQGPQGPQGVAGTNGTDGKTLLSGVTPPTAATGTDGDFYINTATNEIYGPKASGAWGGAVSLVGPTGATGAQGLQGVAGPVGATGATGAQGPQGIQGEQGMTGPQGAQGIAGANGTDGKTLLNGVITPSSAIGTDGDFYINTATNEIYGPKTSGTWGSAVSLVGPTGPTGVQGLQGVAGPTGTTGAQGPQGDQGIQGPQGITGPQGTQGIQGPQGVAGTNGADGKTLLSGVTAPNSATGTDGDFYINTATNEMFGPKTSGTWGSGVSLVGPTGATGAQGPQGIQGEQGMAGAEGPQGIQGPQGPAGTNGKIINVTYHINSTRVLLGALPNANSWTMETIPVNKLSSTSNLIIDGTVSGYNNISGAMQQGWKLGSGIEFQAQALMYANDQYARIYPTKAVIANHTTTGIQNLVFRFYNANGAVTGDRPFNVYNPNSIDDPRLAQTSSVYIIYEIEP